MKEILEKLRQQEEIIAREKGPFDLFALFLREGSPDKWDLVVAADWIEKTHQGAFEYIANMAQRTLSQEELLKLSRIVTIDKRNPGLDALHRAITIEHSEVEIKDSNFFGLQIKHAYIITSIKRKHNAPRNATKTDR